MISTYRLMYCHARNDSIITKLVRYLNKYYSSNFRTIPGKEVRYFGQETEITATLGNNRYTVTDSSTTLTSTARHPLLHPSMYKILPTSQRSVSLD